MKTLGGFNMINYVYNNKTSLNISRIQDDLMLYVVDISCIEDGTTEFPNESRETLFFDNKEKALGAYNEILQSVVVTEYSIFDISLAAYDISELEFPCSEEDIIELYAIKFDSDNEIMSQRVLGESIR